MNKTILIVLLLAALAPGVNPARAADDEKKVLESARSTVARWVETQEIISKEKRDWQAGRDVLEQRISLIEGEIGELRERIAEIRSGLGDTGSKKRDLGDENRALKEAGQSIEAMVPQLEEKTRRLLGRLPEPLRTRIQPLADRIPGAGSESELSLGQRYQNVIGLLNEFNKFNRDLTISSELRELPGGRMAEVRALYLGLGQAYYVTSDGKAAGVGRSGPDGWVWEPADEMADRVRRGIAILENEEVPAYVPLPVIIR